MKNSLFNVLVFVFISFLIFPKTTLISQCEFVAAESSDPVLTDYSATNIHLNLVFHIIRKSDGSGTTTFSDIYAYLDELAAVYNPVGIYFDTLCTKFIDNTSYYEDCRLDMRNDTFPGIQKLYASADAINIFIQPSDGSLHCPGSGNGFIGGYSCWIINQGHRNLCSHEVGHVLNLWHTFETLNGPSCFDDSTSLVYSGDLCEDTPPDYFERMKKFIDTTSCTWDTAGCAIDGGVNCRDSCGNPHTGFDPRIMMSSYHKCTAFFTTDQANRMKDKILNKLFDTDFSSNRADSIITDSVIVDVPWRAAKNIIIESGGVLIVQSTLYMPEESKIVVESGGVLSVDGGTITKGNFKDICGERSGDPKFWYGIEMQVSNGAYPRLSCINGTIEYSENGIHNSTGGAAGNASILIRNSIFLNNKISINFIRSSGISLPIRAWGTRFYLDGSFPLSNYYTQVKIDNSKIYFDSCIFDNPANKVPLDTIQAYSIYSLNSDVEIQKSIFKDKLYGIKCLKALSFKSARITTTKFAEMRIGINISDILDYSITKDTFVSTYKYGLISDGCSGYLLHYNKFFKTGTQNDSCGILMMNSGTSENLIQQNTYVGLRRGNQTEGINGIDGVAPAGLQLLCNKYTNFNELNEVYLKGPISGMQGTSTKATGNEADVDIDHKIDFGAPLNLIVYYYDTIPNHKPDSDPSYRMSKRKINNFDCSTLITTPDTVSPYVTYEKHRDTLNDRKDKYLDSLDGGNTSALLAYIAGSNSGTSTFLYNHLINKSPWLSTNVVLAAYNRSDIFDSTRRAQLIFSNPDPYRIGEFRSALRNADVPLPTSSLDALDTLTLYTSRRTDFEAEMTSLSLQKNIVCYEILNELKMDTIDHSDSIIVWLKRSGDYSSLREVMETYHYNGDFTQASTALSDLSELEDLNDEQLSDLAGLEELVPYLIYVREDDRYEGSLTEGEIEWMIDFAENNNNTAGRQVRSILEFYYGINVDDIESIRSVLDHKRPIVGEQIKQTETEVLSDNVSIFPNPSKNELIIKFNSNDQTTWGIELMDLNGKLLIGRSTTSGYLRLDISSVPNGIFIVQLENNKGEKIVKRIQTIK